MYLSREMTDRSLQQIGDGFGSRAHTTVLHAVTKIARLIREDSSASELVAALKGKIGSPDA